MTVEMGIEKVPREDCRKKRRCSANNLMELCNVMLTCTSLQGQRLTHWYSDEAKGRIANSDVDRVQNGECDYYNVI